MKLVSVKNIARFGLLAGLAATMVVLVNCGSDDEDENPAPQTTVDAGSDSTATDSGTDTGSKTDSGTEDSGSDAAPDAVETDSAADAAADVAPDAVETDAAADATPDAAQKSNIKFCIDTTKTSEGKKLAAVLTGEKAYLVGSLGSDYPSWKPQSDVLAMTESTTTPGTFCITLALVPGTELSYKFVKTSSVSEWGNGEKVIKAYGGDAGVTCLWDGDKVDGGDPPFPSSGFGLYEVANRAYTVPAADATIPTITIDAWRDYAIAQASYTPCKQ